MTKTTVLTILTIAFALCMAVPVAVLIWEWLRFRKVKRRHRQELDRIHRDIMREIWKSKL